MKFNSLLEQLVPLIAFVALTAASVYYLDTWPGAVLAGVVLIMLMTAYFLLIARRNKRQVQQLESEISKYRKDLNDTREQLVQTEKMAALGQLTAGIAHEIQNPLNFITNFSESSFEMMREVETATDEDERQSLHVEVMSNLQKIAQHGKRANNIVRSMLMQSRQAAAEKQDSDINRLVEEFVDLAFHGMRAKDASFNCSIEKTLENDLPKVKIVPQDVSRVMLNIFNNAFYAVEERQKLGEADYKRMVRVRTFRHDHKVGIAIRDNGKGIPQEIKDKIFKPFFTTKPSGQGTGLGLSISYDIITRGHGGELKVESHPNEYTEFIIELPVN